MLLRTVLKHGGGPNFLKRRICYHGQIGLNHNRKFNHDRGTVRLMDLLNRWTKKFQAEGICDAGSSAEYITAYVLGKKTLHNVNREDQYLGCDDVAAIDRLCRLRLKRMPVQYILGEWDFDGMTLKMAPPVLIPRPETEELVDHCKHILQSSQSLCEQSPAVFLELGCGTGAISLALLKHFTQMRAVCVDISQEACSLSKTNAEMVGVDDRIHILHGDFTNVNVLSELRALGPFDLVVSNPPYVTSEQMRDLSPEIARFEDPVALDGGIDGLELVRPILHKTEILCVPNGHLFLEIGEEHPEAIKSYLTENKGLSLRLVGAIKDMLGRNRFCHLQVSASRGSH